MYGIHRWSGVGPAINGLDKFQQGEDGTAEKQETDTDQQQPEEQQ